MTKEQAYIECEKQGRTFVDNFNYALYLLKNRKSISTVCKNMENTYKNIKALRANNRPLGNYDIIEHFFAAKNYANSNITAENLKLYNDIVFYKTTKWDLTIEQIIKQYFEENK